MRASVIYERIRFHSVLQFPSLSLCHQKLKIGLCFITNRLLNLLPPIKSFHKHVLGEKIKFIIRGHFKGLTIPKFLPGAFQGHLSQGHMF